MRLRHNLWVLFIASICGLITATATAQPTAPFGHYKPKAIYSDSLTTSLYLTMRDGVRIAMSLTRPVKNGKPAEGRFPALWVGTLGIQAATESGPIGEDEKNRGYRGVPSLARYGYVVAQVARRGSGPSFGKRRGYNDRIEAYDAYEIIDWLASQPWSSGSVGVFGCSNTGDAGLHAVTAANPHLKAAWLGCFSWDKYDGFLRGGIFANWGTGPERTVEQDMTNTPVQGDEAKVLLRQAAEDHQGSTVLKPMWGGMPYRDSWSTATASRFWYEGSGASYMSQFNKSGTAIYVQGGWSDDLRQQGLIAWANSTNDRHIIIGAWGHCANGDFDLLSEMHRFFDQHLKGIETGIREQDPVHYFTINAPEGSEWKSSQVWPVAGTNPARYYLAGRSSAGGDLASEAPTGAGSVTTIRVRYDVDCPYIKPRGDGLLTGAPPCVLETAGPHFVSPALIEDTEVTGDPLANLWVSSTASDGNFFVYLEDVAPDGKVTPVTDARLKASLRKLDKPRYEVYGLPWHRSHAEDVQLLVPGEPAQLVFSFLPTSYIFKAGHRIRISIQGADYREQNRTPALPAPEVTIYNTSANASFVSLPIINRKN